MDEFGRALFSYWKGNRRSTGSYLRDDGSRSRCDIGEYFSGYEDFPDTDRKALRFARGRTLDIGCGAGRHVLFLQHKGIDIVGIDTSPLAVQVCRERGCKSCETANIFRHDLDQHSFDTILLMGTNIGLAGKLSRVIKLLRICKDLAKRDALLILTTKNVNKRTAIHHVIHRNDNMIAGRYIGERRLRFEYGHLKSDWFKWVFIDPQMLRAVARESGWNVETVFESELDSYSAVLRLAEGECRFSWQRT